MKKNEMTVLDKKYKLGAGVMRVLLLSAVAFSSPLVRADTSVLTPEMKENLILYYSFDQPLSKKIADESGRENNGEVADVKWVEEGHRGGAAHFGDKDSYISVPNTDELNPPYLTLAAWIKTSCMDEQWRRIFDKGFSEGYTLTMGGINKKGKSSQGQVGLEVATSSLYSRTNHLAADGKWHHIVGTFDAGVLRLYIDGWKIRQRKIQIDKSGNNKYDLTIGCNHSELEKELGQSFNGQLDDVMMFNRALSDDEVQTLFKAQGGVVGAKPIPNQPAPDQPAPAALLEGHSGIKPAY